jgi:hypothetical protein
MKLFVHKIALDVGYGKLETLKIKIKFLGKYKLSIHAQITFYGKRIKQV